MDEMMERFRSWSDLAADEMLDVNDRSSAGGCHKQVTQRIGMMGKAWTRCWSGTAAILPCLRDVEFCPRAKRGKLIRVGGPRRSTDNCVDDKGNQAIWRIWTGRVS